MPVINLPTPPGGHIGVAESGLPNGTEAGSARTVGGWSFTISAGDGIDDLTVGGYAAIRDGVFTAGSIAYGPGLLSVTSFDPSNGTVGVRYEITSPHHSPNPGPQQKYGDFLSAAVVLTDTDGDRAEASLLIQIRDDERIGLSSNSATTQAGGPAVTGNLVTDGVPDTFTADGFGGVSAIGDADRLNIVTMPNAEGNLVYVGTYGTLTLHTSGTYSYVARADAPADAIERMTYWAKDGDGDEAATSLTITIRSGTGSQDPDRTLTSPGPNSVLVGGSGNDTLNASQGSDTLTGGAGSDVFAWAAEPWSPATVTDFAVGSDRLDLSSLLQAAGYSGADPVADRYITLMSQGSDTLVLFDRDGAGAAQQWPNYILKLQNVTGAEWAQLAGGGGPGHPPDEEGQVIDSPGPGSTLSGGDGDDTLNASQGSDTLTGGAGEDVFAWAAEPWSPATITDFQLGADRLDLSAVFQAAGYAGSDPVADGRIVLLGQGADTLVLYDDDGPGGDWASYVIKLQGVSSAGLSWSQLADGGTGPGQVIDSPGPGSTLTGGGGDDTLNASRGADTLTGGAGADRFAWAEEPWAPAVITDFQPGADKLDLRALFDAAGYTGADPFADGYLTLLDDGAGGTKVLFDRDAAGPSPQWANYILHIEDVAPAALGLANWIVQ